MARARFAAACALIATCACSCRDNPAPRSTGRQDSGVTASSDAGRAPMSSIADDAASPGAAPDATAAWATWPMPNAAPGLPNQQSFDTRTAGVVLDRVTGLSWQRALTGKLLTFADAKRNCDELTLAGYDDWRLPSRIELVSILDLRRTQPAIDVAAFPNTPSDWFWTSSVAAGDPEAAWYVYFYFGYPKTDLISNQFSVRCVRAAPQKSALVAHYDVQTDTVRDLGTGLTWARAVSNQALAFDAARAYCAKLGLAGKVWRVPSMPELLTLIDERALEPPLIDRSAFPNTPSEAFWSSSSFGGSAGMAWQVYFDRGHALYGLDDVELRVRCVTASP